MADLIYFAAKAIIIKEENVLLLYSYFNDQKSWDFPGGRMSFGEDAETTLIREVMEETGILVTPKKLIDTWHHTKGDFHVTGVFYQVGCKDLEVRLSDEHDGYEWVPIHELTKTVQSRAYMERIMNWDFIKTDQGYVIEVPEIKSFNIESLRPNNLFLSQDKVTSLMTAYDEDMVDYIPPILISKIDDEYVVMDGHSRLFVAYKKGFKKIKGIFKPLGDIEGSETLYKKIHSLAKAEKISTIKDLEERILKKEDHEEKWIGLCDALASEEN